MPWQDRRSFDGFAAELVPLCRRHYQSRATASCGASAGGFDRPQAVSATVAGIAFSAPGADLPRNVEEGRSCNI